MRPLESAGLTSCSTRRSLMFASSAAAIAARSSASASGWPWKLPPLMMSALAVVVEEHSRVVGDAVELALEHLARPARARRGSRRAPAACSGASTRPAPCRSRLWLSMIALVGERARAGSRDHRLPGMRAHAACKRSSNGRFEPLSASRLIAPAMSATCASRCRSTQRERAERRHVLRAVDQREPFLRLEHHGRRPAARKRLAARAAAAPVRGASPSPISASARCASGARSPEAPTEPCEGMRGCTSRLSIAIKQLDELRRARPSGRARAPARGAASCRAPRAPRARGRRRRRGCAPGSAAARESVRREMRVSLSAPKPVFTP